MTTKKGNSEFKRTGIIINYTHVDLTKKQVTATISYEEEIKMSVNIDLNLNLVHKDGSIDEILHILPSRDENSYIEEIKNWAEIFINNKITNPKKYFEQFM